MKIFNKRSESIVRNDPLATSISMWSSSIPTKSLDLNEGQKKAMSLALRREFQLIQGPPGNITWTLLSLHGLITVSSL